MAARFWMNARRMAGLALALLALTAGAAHAASFQSFADPPGGEDLAVIDGVPHVAWTDAQGVHVARLDTASGPWHAVGAPFRHTPGSQGAVADASLASDPAGRPWVAWTEVDVHDVAQVRVARFDGTAWHEVVGGEHPLNPPPYQPGDYVANSGFWPQLTFYEGVPYVGWTQDELGEVQAYVARLRSDGSAWETIGRPGDNRRQVRLVVSGGRLFLARASFPNDTPSILRLNQAGTNWEVVNRPEGAEELNKLFGDVADVQGVLHVLYSRSTQNVVRLDSFQELGTGFPRGEDAIFERLSLAADGAVPYASQVVGKEPNRDLQVYRYLDGSWQLQSLPDTVGQDVDAARLFANPAGGMWLLHSTTGGGGTSWHLSGLGATLPASPPGEPPSGPPEPPPPSGLCSNVINGSARSERLNGTRRSDAIFGRGGNDRIRAFAASDCLYGGSGNDTLGGGRGNDFFRGGAGNDRIRGDSGNDDINGDRGNDRIVGGTGNDEIDAGRGNDVINVARQGADLVACGPGRDTVVISLADRYRDCERVVLRR
jgi:hypothetical protein